MTTTWSKIPIALKLYFYMMLILKLHYHLVCIKDAGRKKKCSHYIISWENTRCIWLLHYMDWWKHQVCLIITLCGLIFIIYQINKKIMWNWVKAMKAAYKKGSSYWFHLCLEGLWWVEASDGGSSYAGETHHAGTGTCHVRRWTWYSPLI